MHLLIIVWKKNIIKELMSRWSGFSDLVVIHCVLDYANNYPYSKLDVHATPLKCYFSLSWKNQFISWFTCAVRQLPRIKSSSNSPFHFKGDIISILFWFFAPCKTLGKVLLCDIWETTHYTLFHFSWLYIFIYLFMAEIMNLWKIQ